MDMQFRTLSSCYQIEITISNYIAIYLKKKKKNKTL